MTEPVTPMFEGDLFFLSNFYPCQITFRGHTYLSTEAAYQAAKARELSPELQRSFSCAPADESKKMGRRLELREDWDEVKIPTMRELLVLKFANPKLRAKLLATGDLHLEETNWWGDCVWGTCKGVGENWLGRLLMELRTNMRTELSDALVK